MGVGRSGTKSGTRQAAGRIADSFAVRMRLAHMAHSCSVLAAWCMQLHSELYCHQALGVVHDERPLGRALACLVRIDDTLHHGRIACSPLFIQEPKAPPSLDAGTREFLMWHFCACRAQVRAVSGSENLHFRPGSAAAAHPGVGLRSSPLHVHRPQASGSGFWHNAVTESIEYLRRRPVPKAFHFASSGSFAILAIRTPRRHFACARLRCSSWPTGTLCTLVPEGFRPDAFGVG
jgi:hypothetical protein